MKHEQLTAKFFKNVLKRRIKEIYREQLKHELRDIEVYYCEKTVIVIIDGIVTKTEKFLNEHSQQFLAQQVRTALDHLIKSQLKNLIEEVMKVTVIDLLCKAKIDTDRMGVIVLFEIHPNFWV